MEDKPNCDDEKSCGITESLCGCCCSSLLKKIAFLPVIVSLLVLVYLYIHPSMVFDSGQKNLKGNSSMIFLPKPNISGRVTVEQTIKNRRSIREYSQEPIELADLSQLLWAAQGVTCEGGYRSAPSAGATYPLETYVAVFNVENLENGIYKYGCIDHSVGSFKSGDFAGELCEACFNQPCVKNATACIIFTAVESRTTKKYGPKANVYVAMEAGHAAQNVYLQAAALELGVVAVGGFDSNKLAKVLGLSGEEKPLYLLAVGKPKS